MVSVIRDMDDENERSSRSVWVWGSAIVLGVLIVASGALAAVNAASLGLPAILLLGGMALVGLFGLMSLLSRKQPTDMIDRRQSMREGAYSEAFFKNPESTIIVEDGKVIHANEAYLALAKRIGAMGVSESAPSVDRLFSASGKETASAIFRLHHMHAETPSAQEIIDTLDADGTLHRYRIHVTNLKPQQLWQITDITKESHAKKVS